MAQIGGGRMYLINAKESGEIRDERTPQRGFLWRVIDGRLLRLGNYKGMSCDAIGQWRSQDAAITS